MGARRLTTCGGPTDLTAAHCQERQKAHAELASPWQKTGPQQAPRGQTEPPAATAGQVRLCRSSPWHLAAVKGTEARNAAGACRAALRRPKPPNGVPKEACSHAEAVRGRPPSLSRQPRTLIEGVKGRAWAGGGVTRMLYMSLV